MLVGVGRIFEFVCLSVCLQHSSKTNDPKVFKLGVGPWAVLEVVPFWGSKVKVTGSIALYNNASFPTTIAFFHIR